MLQTNPLSNHNLLISKDLYETEQQVGKLIWPHHMYADHLNRDLDARLDGLALEDMGLFYLRYGADVQIDAGEISDYYLIQTALSGKALIINGSMEAQAKQGFTTLISPRGSTRINMDSDCSYLVLMLKRQAVEKQLTHQLDSVLKAPILFDLQATTAKQSLAIQQTVGYLCRQYNELSAQLRSPSIARQFADLAISLVLNTWHHNYTDKLDMATATPLPWHVRKAIDFIQANIADGLSLQTIAQEVGVSGRTLQKGFNHFLQQTPSEYIRSLKLNRVHQSLLTASPQNHSVTSIMLQYGISDQGRFANLYKKRFGELPSETLRR